MTRLPPLDETKDAEFARALNEVEKSRGKASNALRSMGHAPEGLKRFADVGDYVRYHSSLTARQREIVIVITGRHYEYAMMHHVPLARQAGILDKEIEVLRQGGVPESFPDKDVAIVHFVLEYLSPGSVTDETFSNLMRFFSPRQITDVSFTISYYVAFAMMLSAMKPEPDSVDYVKQGLKWQLDRDAH